ncbi:MAG TPA: DUF4124 domain-containing protein [Variovorax sp.]|jgi:hypothetical protein|nr:DUF4124 domain-containing protein [Variovorax sp.]
MPLRRSPPSIVVALALLAASWSCGAWSQARPQTANEAGIFTCTDARGRTLTADRPIADCADREQRELGPSGVVRRTLEPTYTSREQSERDERARLASQKAARLMEERRRDRALLARYPNPASHERERGVAVAQVDAVIEMTRKRMAEITAERKPLDDELEFYRRDVSRAPMAVRRRLEDNTASMKTQVDLLAGQQEERRRVNARFDEERERLRLFWPAAEAASPPAR